MAEFIGADFTKRKKDVIKITLPVEEGSDEGFEVSILPPTKRGYEAMSHIAGILVKWGDGDLEAADFDMQAILESVAEVMSHNLQMKRITPEFLDSIGFDLTDVGEFVGSYIYFVMQLVEEKNLPAPGPTRKA